MKNLLFALSLCILAVQSQSCDYAQANVSTLVTDDCGVTWRLIKAGKSIPKGMANPCHFKVTIPDYPMQGDSRFKIMFAENVLASIDVSYDYTIIGPISFISEAKFLGKVNADNAGSQFETAENMVIDKRIKDVVRGLLLKEDVVTFSPSDFEDIVLPSINKTLNTRGVNINYISFVPVFDEQTAQAIDVATAMKIYQSKNLVEVGEKVMVGRASASKVLVSQAPAQRDIRQDED